MTKQEKLAVLIAAETKAYEALDKMAGVDLASEAADHLFRSLESLEWAINRNIGEDVSEEHVPEPDIEKGEVKPTKMVKLDPLETPKPGAPEEPESMEKPEAPTKQQMITKLTAFQNNGVAIDSVMQGMGYAKLSQVPADRYWELLELCQKEADGEG